jgi:phosphoribosylaminoimidazole carboxylase (NCAIR synthetase)
MIHLAYITPYFTPNTLRFLEAIISFHQVRLILISQETSGHLPSWLLSRVSLSRVIPDVMDAKALAMTLSEIRRLTGKIDRLLGATEQLQVTLAEARNELGIEGMEVETAHNFRDKSRMKQLFEKAGIPCAKHSMVFDIGGAHAFTKRCPFPVVIKPVSGAGSQTTFRANNDAELANAFDRMGNVARHGVVVEEFVQGDEFSLDTFSVNGKIIGQTINQYFPTPLEVMTHPWIQWRVILRKDGAGKAFDDIRHAGKKALDALGMTTGMSHMEWFRRKDGSIAISEVAARPPGAQFTTLISRACDFDAVRAWVQLMIFGKADIPDIRYNSGAAYLRGQGHGRVDRVEGVEEMKRRYNDIITDIRLPRIGQEKSASYEGEGYIILKHPEYNVVENALADIVSNIKVVMSEAGKQ